MKRATNNDVNKKSSKNDHSYIDMNSVAGEVENNLNMSGRDGRIVSENREKFDDQYLAMISGGLSHQEAVKKAIGFVSLDLARDPIE